VEDTECGFESKVASAPAREHRLRLFGELRRRIIVFASGFCQQNQVSRRCPNLRFRIYFSKLAEALITHGRALARLGSYRASLAGFRRAIALAEDSGHFNRVADAAVAAFQELGDHLITSEGQEIASDRTFIEAKELLEPDYIKRALELYHGSITHAARSLGMSHQTLNYMLHTRHKDLLEKRRPERRDSRKK
jgi:hypothetical protein